MSHLKRVALLLSFMLVFVACQSQPTPAPAASPVAQLPTATATSTVTQTATPISTATQTPTPTVTSTPSATPSPTLTPVSLTTIEPMALATVEPTPAGQPQLTLVAQEGGGLTSMAVENGRLYTNEGAQLVVVDVSDPTKPQVVGRSQFLPFIPHYMVALNGVLYVGAGTQLQVWDVKNPAGLTLLHHYQLPGYIENLWNTNQQIWLYWQPYQLANGLIPDLVLSQVVEGQLLNSLEVDVQDLQLKGETFWYTSERKKQETLWQLSLTDKMAHPVLTVPFPISDFAFYGSELHLVSFLKGWLVYEQTPAGWQFQKEIEGDWQFFVERIEVIDSLAYVSDRFCDLGGCTGGIFVYELTPAGAQFLARTDGGYREVQIYEKSLYFQYGSAVSLAWKNGTLVKDILFRANGPVDDVALTADHLWQLRGTLLYQANLTNGLPTSPSTYVLLNQSLADISIHKPYLIGVHYDSGVNLFPLGAEITTTEPFLIEQYWGQEVKFQESLLAVLAEGVVYIWDITKPITPILVDSLPPAYQPNAFGVTSFIWEGSKIYMVQDTADELALKGFDMIIPTKSIPLDKLDLEEAGLLIASFPDVLYLSTPTELLVVDVSNPGDMVITTRLPLGYQLGEMVVFNGRGYSLQGNLSIFDLSNPAEPQLLMKVSSPLLRADSFPYPVANLAVGEQYIYVAAGDAGLLVFEQP